MVAINRGNNTFRALMIYPMTDTQTSWPLLQWEEGSDDVFMVFDVDDEKLQNCSWLLCRGPRNERGSPAPIVWEVTDLSALGTLFGAVQQLLGVLEMPRMQAVILYCQSESKWHSVEGNATLPVSSGILR